jgi:uncharacterized protein
VELTPEESRVLGCLLEKERTTPDAYPLTLNALVGACNQSTNREPVVAYNEATVEDALTSLRERGLARRGMYLGSRVTKHRHSADEQLDLSPPELALLGVLLLRGPQTPGELKARTERLHRFAQRDDLNAGLASLMSREPPLVAKLAREPGRKEARYVELLSDAAAHQPISPERSVHDVSAAPAAADGRLDALEDQVQQLRSELDDLRQRLGE